MGERDPLHELMQLLASWGRERLRLNEVSQRSRPNVLYALSGEAAEAERRNLKHDGSMFASLIRGTGPRPDYDDDSQVGLAFARVDYEITRMPDTLERARKVLYIEYDPRWARRPLVYRAALAELNRRTYKIALDQGHAYMMGRLMVNQ